MRVLVTGEPPVSRKPDTNAASPLSKTELDKARERFSDLRKQNRMSLQSSSKRAAFLTTNAGTPSTMASTNLYLGYIDGFLQEGIDAHLLAYEQKIAPTINDPLLHSDIFLPAFYVEKYKKEFVSSVLESEKFNYVISHGRKPDLFAFQSDIIRSSGGKHFMFCGESPIRWWPDDVERDAYNKLVLECFDGVIVPSTYLKDYWASVGLSDAQIYVSRQPVRDTLFPPKSHVKHGHKALYAGNLSHEEIDDLLDIAAIVKKSIDDFELLIYGDDLANKRDSLAEKISSRDLSAVVKLQAALPLSELAKAEVNSDLLLLPRRCGEFSKAGFPNKVGEYLLSGTPTVCTRVGEIASIVGEESALFVDPGNLELFAETILEAFRDYSHAQVVAESGLNWARDNISSKVVAQQLSNWLDDVKPRR